MRCRVDIRSRRVALSIVVLALFGTGACTNTQASHVRAAQTPLTRTEVIRFEPRTPAGPTQQGYCWTGSIADPREGAWRCMTGNAIHDPCFAVVGRTDAVVCAAEPFGRQKPFLLKLMRPLKTAQVPHRGKRPPWIVELEDGTRCGKLTGTLAAAGGEPVGYGCWNPARKQALGRQARIGLLDDFTRGKVWTVSEVVLAPSANSGEPFRLIERKRVTVRTVWW